MKNLFILLAFFISSLAHGEGFMGCTLVKTPEGYKRIDEIQADEYVFGLDGNKKSHRVRVEAVLGSYKYNWCIISIDGTKITVDSDHKFYHFTKAKWVRAKNLKIGDLILDGYGAKVIVSDDIEIVNKSAYAYTLALSKYHNFLITDKDVVVHNVIPLIVWGVGGIAFAGWDVVAAGTAYTLGAIALGWGVNRAMRKMGAHGSVDYENLWEAARKIPPGYNDDWVKVRGAPGFKDPDGNIWTPDMKHRNRGAHWDVNDPSGTKIREVNDDGTQIWPDGPKNKNKTP